MKQNNGIDKYAADSKPRFRNVAHTQLEEDAYDLVAERNAPKPSGVLTSVAHLVKGALGAGILSGHVGYMKAGCWLAVAVHLLLGVYMAYCLHILIHNAQILYKRTRVPSMTYPDLGEAAMLCTGNPVLIRFAKVFRYAIDTAICMDMLGSCASYQIIIAKSIKQLVEDSQKTSLDPLIAGYPNLRMYIAMMIIPCILICMTRYLQWLAPFTIVANFVIVLCIGVTVYYAVQLNPKFEHLATAKDFDGFFQFVGISVFGMSCAGVVVSIENNMADPSKFPRTLFIGMALIVAFTLLTAFFGYVAFLENCEAPITINFPMQLFPKILKVCIIAMIYVTHGLNFWVPFNLLFHYIKRHLDQDRIIMWEYVFRGTLCFLISCVAIAFPSISSLCSLHYIWPEEPPSRGPKPFVVVNKTYEEEAKYDLLTHRNLEKPSGVPASIANIIKGGLGAGVLGAHAAYAKGGVVVAAVLTVVMGAYMTYCLHILVMSGETLCRRTATPVMTYSDVGEASLACCGHPKLQKLAKLFRYCIDVSICIDLFGSCAVYQLIISKTIKQMVEDTVETSMVALKPGYPDLRIYLLCIMLPCAGICLVRHLDYLGKVSVIGNALVFTAVIMTVYYSMQTNPTLAGMTLAKDPVGVFTFMGMVVFSMSCAGIVIAIENNMREPHKFPAVLVSGMTFIVVCIMIVGILGYSAWLEKSESPVTMHFPMTLAPKLLKVGIAVMIYITHAINFFVPFSLTYHYIKRLHPPDKEIFFEYVYRGIFSCLITVLAIVFPDVNKIMGICGTVCLSNLAFIWPCCIYLLVYWDNPGLGRFNWRLWKCIILVAFGVVLLVAGSAVTISDMFSLFGLPDPFNRT